MHLTVLTPWDPEDPRAWSGVLRPMLNALRENNGDRLEVVSTSGTADALLDRAWARASGIFDRAHLPQHAPWTARRLAATASHRIHALPSGRSRVLVAIAGSSIVAHLPRHWPVVQVSDATFSAMEDYYPLFSNLSTTTRYWGRRTEARSVRRTHRFVMASQWAADHLQHDYRVPSPMIEVAPFGPSISTGAPSRLEFTDPLQPVRPLRLLCVASHWHRKGGDRAVAVWESARAQGLEVDLTVIGDHPKLPPGVRALGRLDHTAFRCELGKHDILIELARANAGGVTLTDAAHAGLPVITTRTGGVDSIVADGISGHLIDPDLDEHGLVSTSVDLLSAQQRGATGVTRDRVHHHARQHLTWDDWATAVQTAAQEALRAFHEVPRS